MKALHMSCLMNVLLFELDMIDKYVFFFMFKNVFQNIIKHIFP